MFVDLLFFNRELNSLVAVELKSGKFRSSYLGQLSTYLSALDTYVRKPHENPAIGILLCRDMNQSLVELAIRDYDKPIWALQLIGQRKICPSDCAMHYPILKN